VLEEPGGGCGGGVEASAESKADSCFMRLPLKSATSSSERLRDATYSEAGEVTGI